MALDLQAADQARDREPARGMRLLLLDRRARGRMAGQGREAAAEDDREQSEQAGPAESALAHDPFSSRGGFGRRFGIGPRQLAHRCDRILSRTRAR